MIEPSVIYRNGIPTENDYEEAIGILQQALSQLEPNSLGCVICNGSDHQAYECPHNPLVVARELTKALYTCFHCGEHMNEKQALAHFGPDGSHEATCLPDHMKKLRRIVFAARELVQDMEENDINQDQLREINEALNDLGQDEC